MSAYWSQIIKIIQHGLESVVPLTITIYFPSDIIMENFVRGPSYLKRNSKMCKNPAIEYGRPMKANET